MDSIVSAGLCTADLLPFAKKWNDCIWMDQFFSSSGQTTGVGSYLLLNTIFHCPFRVVHPIVFCDKSIVIFVRFTVIKVNPETRSMRYDTTQTQISIPVDTRLMIPFTPVQKPLI